MPTVSGSYDATGEHSGDVLTTNSGSHADTDANNNTLVVSAVRVGSTEGRRNSWNFRTSFNWNLWSTNFKC